MVLHGFRKGLAVIVLGETHDPHLTRALVVWLSGLAGIVVIHVVTTMCSHRRPRFVQKATQSITDPLRTLLFGHEISAQHYSHADISPYFWVNGRAPKEETYLAPPRLCEAAGQTAKEWLVVAAYRSLALSMLLRAVYWAT